MPAKLYQGAGGQRGSIFVKTGAFRPPRKGEWFLSGAIPEAYLAYADGAERRDILRLATGEEMRCATCGQRLPYSTKA